MEAIRNASVLVVGDAMLDRYWFGDASRISPEAPVPVVKVTRTEDRLGGAANVARNSASLEARTSLLAIIGDDEAGTKIMDLLEASKVRPCLYRAENFTTTLKLRILARNMQMLRTILNPLSQEQSFDSILTALPLCCRTMTSSFSRITAKAVWTALKI